MEQKRQPEQIADRSLPVAENSGRHARSLLLFASLATFVLYFLPYSQYPLYPLRLFVTFIHESGHAFATVLSGGEVASLTVHPDTSGVTLSNSPSWALGLVFSAGYLGATLFGALMLQVGRLQRWSNAGRAALWFAAGYLFVITLLWAHNPFTNLFTLLTGMLLAAGLGLLARYATARVAGFLASFLAVQCCLDALNDLRNLLYITTNHLGDNDAVFMSQHYPLPPTFWAVVWAGIAFVMLGLSLRSYWRGTSQPGVRQITTEARTLGAHGR